MQGSYFCEMRKTRYEERKSTDSNYFVANLGKQNKTLKRSSKTEWHEWQKWANLSTEEKPRKVETRKEDARNPGGQAPAVRPAPWVAGMERREARTASQKSLRKSQGACGFISAGPAQSPHRQAEGETSVTAWWNIWNLQRENNFQEEGIKQVPTEEWGSAATWLCSACPGAGRQQTWSFAEYSGEGRLQTQILWPIVHLTGESKGTFGYPDTEGTEPHSPSIMYPRDLYPNLANRRKNIGHMETAVDREGLMGELVLVRPDRAGTLQTVKAISAGANTAGNMFFKKFFIKGT